MTGPKVNPLALRACAARGTTCPSSRAWLSLVDTDRGTVQILVPRWRGCVGWSVAKAAR